jgi:glycosyltransferase involved in cell wall biosynthesis
MAQDPLNLLCIEPRFPGRLGGTADWLVRHRGYHCWFFCASTDPPEHWPASAGKGLQVVGYQAGGAARESAVTWTRYLERGLCHAYGCWETLESRRPRPVDLVLGRSAGLGSTLFAPVYVSGVPVVNYFDYFYHAHANDLAAEAGQDMPVEYFHWRRSANGMDLLDLESSASAWTATHWQRDLFPSEYHTDFLVLHDGVNAAFTAAQGRTIRRVAGRSVPPDTLVVSFVARNLDRVRGFDRFLELANRLMRRYPSLVCIVLGGPIVQRGLDFRFFNQDYAAQALKDNPPHDPQRLWLLGSVPPGTVAEVLAASDLHIYPSRPYPVSRSLLEALGSGCIVLAADTEPVREIVTDKQTGLLTAGHDLDGWERQACAVLDDLAGHRPLAAAAARIVRENYSRDVTLPRLAAYFNELAERALPS